MIHTKDVRKTSGNLETLLEQLKRMSIIQKDYLEVTTKMVQANSFKNNNIKNVLNYVPFVLTEDGNAIVDEESYASYAFASNLSESSAAALYSSSQIQRVNNTNGTTTVTTTDMDGNIALLPSDEITLYEDDNTLSEIINQKMIGFRRGEIIPSLNKETPVFKNAEEKTQKILESFVNVASQSIDHNIENIQRYIEDSKYYPYAGVAFMPISYNQADKEAMGRPNNRKIEVNPLNLDIDGSVKNINNAEWAVVAEKVSFKDFFERAKAGEYSHIKDTSDKVLRSLWNTEDSYQFVTKNFVEQAISRETLLRASAFTSTKIDEKTGEPTNEDFNLIGIIDYMWLKNLNNEWCIYIFLNGNLIGETDVDSQIDVLPIALFSESPSIDHDLDFNGNLAFKLISNQLTIIELNHKKAKATEKMAPVIANVFVSDDNDVDTAKDNTEITTDGNEITLFTIGVKNPNTANNAARVLLGSQVYIQYLQELDTLISRSMEIMRTKAGLTDFTQGTAAGSFNSQAGLDSIKIAGLEGEQDVVKALEASLIKIAILEAYFILIDLTNGQHKKKNETGIANDYRTRLSLALDNYKDILTFNLETRYQEQFTQSVIQQAILPLAAQSGHFDVTLGILKELPLTDKANNAIDKMIAQIKQKQEEEQKAQQQQQQAAQEGQGPSMGSEEATKKKNQQVEDGKQTASDKTTKEAQGGNRKSGGEASTAKNQKQTNSKGKQAK